MAYTRIFLSPTELRQKVFAMPPLNLNGLLKMAVEPTVTPPRGRHLDQRQALYLAIDLLGLSRVHQLVPQNPQLVNVWMALLEDYGWGPTSSDAEVKVRDLQATLVANAIKTIVRSRSTHHLDTEGQVHDVLESLELGTELQMKIVQHLILDKCIEAAWATWVY